jgi:hypothetical protein
MAVMSISGLVLYYKLAGEMKENVETVHMVLGWGILRLSHSILSVSSSQKKPIRTVWFRE